MFHVSFSFIHIYMHTFVNGGRNRNRHTHTETEKNRQRERERTESERNTGRHFGAAGRSHDSWIVLMLQGLFQRLQTKRTHFI